MSKRLGNLNTIVGLLNSGARQYRKAARQSSGSELETVFLEHAELREKAAHDIATRIDAAGGEPADGAPGEEARNIATQVGAFFNDTHKTLVDALEEHEDRTLEAFREAIHHKDNADDHAMLQDYMEQFRRSHDRMRKLKHSKNPKEAAAGL